MNRYRLVAFALVIGILVIGSLLTGPWFAPRANAGRLAAAPITQLTNNPAADVRPMWSPDNRQIAFMSSRDGPSHVYLMNPDGSNQRALTKGKTEDRHPVWMPDGKQIVFDSGDGGASEIWLVNVADGALKQITKLGGLASFPSPSPDGKTIVFYWYQADAMNLWIVKTDGSAPKALTKELATAKNEQCTFACHQAGWSPDGKTIAYPGGDKRSIWVMGADGSGARAVLQQDGGDISHFPWFLADGRLAYVSEHVESMTAWTDAWTIDMHTGERTILQDYMALQGPMEWNREMSRVLFHSPRSGNFEIYLIDLSVPGGVEILQGTPVPNAAAVGTPAPFVSGPVSTSSAPATAGASDSATLALIAVLAAAMVGVIALFIWFKSRAAGKPS
ncbi:MAG: PD40 domain-containing protein [Chloroflexi bacterium]|nr:PD40 domain-containing protein [Chloroflexota bacterium]